MTLYKESEATVSKNLSISLHLATSNLILKHLYQQRSQLRQNTV
jgi:hypothetical protein